MDEHSGHDHPQSRVKRRAGNMWRSAFLALVAVLAAGFVAGYYLYLHNDHLRKDQQPALTSELDNSAAGPSAQEEQHPPSPAADRAAHNADTSPETKIPPTVTGRQEEATLPQAGEEKGHQQENSPQFYKDEIEQFYVHLDQQNYLRGFGIEEKSRPYLSKLMQKLADNPPVVLRETDNLYTLLKNSSHFFRVVGKKNIQILKGLVDKDVPRLERILKAYYDLRSSAGQPSEEFGLSLPSGSLTAYAGYFLNSMGGRLYLFRRPPGTRMLVSYYAILIIDQANGEGNQPLGIDLRPAIGALIKDMEDGGSSLDFRQQYLEKLYRLEEKYN